MNLKLLGQRFRIILFNSKFVGVQPTKLHSKILDLAIPICLNQQPPNKISALSSQIDKY